MRYPPVIKDFPHLVHGGDYNPDQWMDKAIWDEDFRIAKACGINSLTVGIFSWTSYEPEEGKYTFDWLDEIMDRMAAQGMKAILATPSGAKPAWMAEKYEEIRRVRADGLRAKQGGRHNHCLTSPVYRQKVTEMNTRLAERYKDHPALGAWHISNEYGGECFCPLCQQRFRDWLKAKYHTLDNLNKAWWTAFWSHTYTDWSQVEAPSPIGETSVHGLNLDWKRFTTAQFIDFYHVETAPLKAITPDVPCTTNLMSTYPGINYFDLGRELDFVSWDNYPQWTGRTAEDIPTAQHASFCHDLMRGVGGQKPFFLMESSPSATNWRPFARLHRPGVHILQELQAVAHGADSVQYFQFRKSRGSSEKLHGAVIDHVGHENTRVTREVAALGERLASMDRVVGLNNPAKVALIYDWENAWALNDAHGLNNKDKGYQKAIEDHYRALWKLGVNVDIVDEKADYSPYAVLIAPMLYLLREGCADRIRAFVEAGGTYIATYATGWVDESDLCFLTGFPGPLRDVLGVWAEELDVLMPDETARVNWQGKAYAYTDYAEQIHPETAKTLATYMDDFYAGNAALTRNAFGKGAAYFLAVRPEDAFLSAFYRSVLAEAEVPFLADLPEGVSVVTRGEGDEAVTFALNYTAEPQAAVLPDKSQIALAPHEVKVI